MQSLTYTWDGYGNLTERQDANQSLTETFGYDDLNRLTSSMVTNPAANGPTLGFGYDAAGNIETKTLAAVTSTYTYDPNHPYAVDNVTNVNGGTYTASYDADGNMTSRNGAAITWTPANLPASIAGSLGSSTFNYDPDGNRYSQSAQFNSIVTNTTYIAGGLFEVVASSSDTEYRHNILADDQVIAVHTIDANHNVSTDYLHYDQLGSMDTITNATGSVIQSMSFDAWGNRRLATSWDYGVSQSTLATMNNYTNRGYTDQEQLDNLSLVDMNGRVYDPTVGRFISADPTMPNPLYSQAFNRFAYVYNSPLIRVDSTGYTNWPLLGLGLLHMGTGIGSLLGGGSLAVSGVVTIAAGAGTSEFGVGILLIGFGGSETLVGISNATTGATDIAQSGEEIYSSVFGDGSVPPSAITQIYGPTTGSILTDTSFIHDLLEKATQTVSTKLLEAALKQAAQQSAPNSGADGGGSGGGNGGGEGRGPDSISFPPGCGCTSYVGPNERTNGNTETIKLQPVVVTGGNGE